MLFPIRACKDPKGGKETTSQTLYFVDGIAALKDQMRDYKYRGVGLSSMSMLDFILNTYEGKKICEPSTGDKRKSDGSKAVGRPPNERHEYLEPAKKGKMCRIVRSKDHETTPRICGSWFARRDSASESDLHKATMLALLVPWRNIRDIVGEQESFESRYGKMLENIDEKGMRFIENAQYYHECLDGAREKDPEDQSETVSVDLRREIADLGLEDYGREIAHTITESEIDIARVTRTKPRDRLYAEAAIDFAIDHGIFSENVTDRSNEEISAPATEIELGNIDRWEKQLTEFNKASATHEREDHQNMPTLERTIPPVTAREGVLERTPVSMAASDQLNERFNRTGEETGETRPMLAVLNKDQRRAHDIIEDTLKKHITGE